MKETIKEQLLQILDNNGVVILQEEEHLPLQMDSIQFISIVVQVEEEFGIEIPDECLTVDVLNTFDDFVSLIDKFST